MKLKPFLTSILLPLTFTVSFGQSDATSGKSKWTAKTFDHKFFIENKGQFDQKVPSGNTVLFQAILGNTARVYFTTTGIIYTNDEWVESDEDPTLVERTNADPDRALMEMKTHFLQMQWLGIDPYVTAIPSDQKNDYYIYPTGSKTSIKVALYKKIVYHDLYPGIDAEYTFPKDKSGLEYSLIVHPGADITKVKIKYTGAGVTELLKDGNLVIKSELPDLTEHAPISFYQDNYSKINSGFTLKDSIASFSVTGVDRSKTLVIDPWVTDPNFGNNPDFAYDMDFDNAGNVYVYGGYDHYQVEKLDNTGNILWTFNTTTLDPYYYGAFAVDKKSQSCYITEGANVSTDAAQVLKVDPNGNLLATFPGNRTMQEMWRIKYNSCSGSIVIGGGGTTAPYQACLVDTNMVNLVPINVLSADSGFHDMCLIAMDPSGADCYMATTHTNKAPGPGQPIFDNTLFKIPVPSLTPTAYLVSDGFHFNEIESLAYVGSGIIIHYPGPSAGPSACANGMNGMAASFSWLYMYDGQKLRQCDKTTGLCIDSIKITKISFEWGGLDVDACDDIYVGVRDSIHIYNSSLKLDTVLAMQDPSDTVYSVLLGHNNLLYACGRGFVMQTEAPVLPKIISSASAQPASTCSACDGKATVNVNCGNPPFTYKWFDGTTEQSDSNLCPGVYSVTVSDASCPPYVETTQVTVTPGKVADITVPNVFTPNGDGINDLFNYIIPRHATAYSMVIYDRWGIKIFSTTDQTVFWNGKIDNTGSLVPDGTYYYILKADCGSLGINKKGFVQVIGEQK